MKLRVMVSTRSPTCIFSMAVPSMHSAFCYSSEAKQGYILTTRPLNIAVLVQAKVPHDHPPSLARPAWSSLPCAQKNGALFSATRFSAVPMFLPSLPPCEQVFHEVVRATVQGVGTGKGWDVGTGKGWDVGLANKTKSWYLRMLVPVS